MRMCCLLVPLGGGAQYKLNGRVDNLSVYNYARTPAQIAWDYNRGKPVAHYKMDECEGGVMHDASGNGNDGTWNGTAGGTQTSVGTCQTSGTAWGNGASGKFNASLNFDGTDDYINQPASISNVYSVSFFAKSASATPSFLQLASGVNISATNGTVSATGFTSPTIVVNGKTNGTFKVGEWNHITITTNTPITADAIKFGLVGSTYYQGQIDDVRIYNYPLSTEQIKLLANNASALRFEGATCGQYSVSYEGETYGTVKIGSQCWLNKNLNVGTMLASGTTQPSNNATIEKWCYNNDTNLCSAEGGLYN